MPVDRLREAFGLPHVDGRWSVLAAAVVDSLGSGLFLPFAVVYFLRTTPLTLVTVGAGLSIATATVIVIVPLTGLAVDRFGAVSCVVTANLLQTAGFVGYLTVRTLWELVLFALVVAAGQRLFWTGNGAFVALIAEPGERTRWFGLLRALRNGGVALGGGLAAVAAAAGSATAYRLLVVGNAASFLLAAGLMVWWYGRSPLVPAATGQAGAASPALRNRVDSVRVSGMFGYRVPLTDHPFLLLVTANFLLVLCTLVVDLLLAVYLIAILRQPAWVAGLLFTVNGILVVAAQTAVTRHTEQHRPTRVLQLSTLLWAVSFLILWALTALPALLVLPALIAAILAVTAAEIICMPILNALALALAPVEQQGRYFAIQGLTWVGPQAIAPAAFTWLLTRGSAWPWITMLAVCAVNAAILTRLRRHLCWRVPQLEQPGCHR